MFLVGRQSRFKLLVEQFAKLIEQFYRRYFYLLNYMNLSMMTCFVFSLFVNIIYKFGK